MTNYYYEIKTIASIKTIGLVTPITKSQNKNNIIIQNIWKKFNADINKIKNRKQNSKNWRKFGIIYKDDTNYFYMPAIEKNDAMEIPSHLNMQSKTIKGGNYISFIHVGAMNNIKTTVYNIYKNIIPKEKIEIQQYDKAELIHFELYDYRFHWNRSDSMLNIYLPLKGS